MHSHGPGVCIYVQPTAVHAHIFVSSYTFWTVANSNAYPCHMGEARGPGGWCSGKSCRLSPAVTKPSSIMCASAFTSCGGGARAGGGERAASLAVARSAVRCSFATRPGQVFSAAVFTLRGPCAQSLSRAISWLSRKSYRWIITLRTELESWMATGSRISMMPQGALTDITNLYRKPKTEG